MERRNIALKISYDGTCFHGWQFQKNANSVQETLEQAWLRLTGEKISLNGSSRTDAGVHAKGMVANFFTKTRIPTDRIHLAFNSRLPDSIAVLQAVDVEPAFHARFDSLGKHYTYLLYMSHVKPILERRQVAHVVDQLNIEQMQAAAKLMIGCQDFSCFMDQGSPVHDTIRTLYQVSVTSSKEHIIQIDIIGDGFLYHMVRIIAGTLFYVGSGKIEVNHLKSLISKGDRKMLGKTMPAHGLCLQKVFYKEKLFGHDDQKAFFLAAEKQEE